MVYVWNRRRVLSSTSMARVFGCMGLWAAFGVLEMLLPAGVDRMLLMNVSHVAYCLFIPSVALFLMEFATRKSQQQAPAVVALYALYGLFFVVHWLNPLGLFYESVQVRELGGFLLLDLQYGPLYWPYAGIGMVIPLIPLGLLVVQAFQGRTRVEHMALMVLGIMLPWAGNLLYILKVFPFDTVALAFMPSCLCFFLLYRHQLFTYLPIARRDLIDALSDGVLLVNEKGEVLEGNMAAAQMLGFTGGDATIHEAITQAIRDWPLNLSGDEGTHFYQPYALPGQELRRYSITVNRLRSDTRSKINHALVMRDETALHHMQERLHFLEEYDEATGLYHRRRFIQLLQAEMERCETYPQSVVLICAGVLHFKEYCFVYGHAFGNALLSMVGARIRGVLRQSAAIGYFSDEELYFYFRCENDGISINAHTDALMARVYEALTAPFEINGIALHLRLQAGVAFCPQHTTSCDELIAMAGAAKRSVDSMSKNLYTVFHGRAEISQIHDLQLEQDLFHALERDELFLMYQPQVDVRTGRVTGAEALLRWMHPAYGLVPPLEFIPIAENNGLIQPIGLWVLDKAMEQLAEWAKQGLGDVRMSVNISVVQLTSATFADQVLHMIDQRGIAPKCLELEITESIALFPEALMHGHLKRLRDKGVRVAMDDFGMGHSSLSYIKEFALDTIKIDRLLSTDILNNQISLAMVRSVRAMCESIGMDLVVEYIESLEQANAFEAIGCYLLQGFVFSPPLLPEACTNFIVQARKGIR
jgi:diguanylate cyclase (GGDEF)-like protein